MDAHTLDSVIRVAIQATNSGFDNINWWGVLFNAAVPLFLSLAISSFIAMKVANDTFRAQKEKELISELAKLRYEILGILHELYDCKIGPYPTKRTEEQLCDELAYKLLSPIQLPDEEYWEVRQLLHVIPYVPHASTLAPKAASIVQYSIEGAIDTLKEKLLPDRSEIQMKIQKASEQQLKEIRTIDRVEREAKKNQNN